MKFNKGLFTDCLPVDQPEGTYRFAKNIVDGDIQFALEVEKGLTLKGTIPQLNGSGTEIIGVIPVRGGAVLFLTDNVSSEIGLFETSYTTIYNNAGLNFNKSRPIKGEFRINVNNERIVAWIDDLNTPRILNIDDPSTITSITDLDIFQDVTNPEVSITLEDSGGSLPTAAYIPITRYRGSDGSVTNWFVHDKTVFINDEPRSASFQECDGAPAGTTSNKSFTLVFTGLDTRYETLEIGYIKSQDQIVTAYLATEKQVSTSVTITITGSESTTEVSIDEAVVAQATYRTAKAITQLQGSLILGNLTASELPDLQPYALGIKINYTHTLQNVISNTNSHKDRTPLSFMPGEVYAFYLGVELLNGTWAYYHIPGRSEMPSESTTEDMAGLSYQRYQVRDTSSVPGAQTNMSFWKNTGEFYPNDPGFNGTSLGYEDLRGKNVRHHRFPTLQRLVNEHYSGNTTVGVTHLPRLGISVTNVQIPVEAQSQIKRWKIFYAKKDKGNSLVLGSDLAQFSYLNNNVAGKLYTNGGNWQIETELATSFMSIIARQRPIQFNSLRGHCLDFLLDPASANPVYAYFPYKLRRTNINTQWSGFRSNGGMLCRNGNNAGQVGALVVDYTVPASTTRINVTNQSAFRRLDNFKFLPNNSEDGNLTNVHAEGNFTSTLQGDTTLFSIGFLYNDLLLNGDDVDPDVNILQEGTAPHQTYNGLEDTWYMMYGRILSNVHSSFTTQDLVPTEGYATPSATQNTSVVGGDTYLCYMSYLACAPFFAGAPLGETSPTTGVRAWKGYIGYSRNNWNFRHEEPGVQETKYLGKTDPRNLFDPVITNVLGNDYKSLLSTADNLNQVRYNSDYSLSNTFFPPLIYSPNLINETKFLTTIIWSPTQGEETRDVSWRSFPVGNRYTMPKNKGAIINLQGINNRDLLIHHENTLYRTRTDASLATDAETIHLKSNELFAIEPQELLSTNEGYAGTQNKFSCVLTKHGYFFVDNLQTKVFLLNGDKLEEISAFGMQDFFKTFLGVDEDNPFSGNGYTAVYDEVYNRILLTKLKLNESFTISYNPTKRVWTSFHDFTPNYLYRTYGKEPIAIFNQLGNIYSVSTGQRGVYVSTAQPSIVDVVFNQPVGVKKEFSGVKWDTKSYNGTSLDYMDTISHITVFNDEQSTGRVQVVRMAEAHHLYDSNTRVLDEEWMFDELRDIAIGTGFQLGFYSNYDPDLTKLDINQQWYDKRKIISKFVTCRFEYPNLLNRRFLIISVDPIIEPYGR